ncbi:acyl-CoA binding protein [Coleophoma cylindrospora]|uniref:Acyl-CoA binding protein n=1 Tax=Coleophoma cylindrospora TaxID=1849047 RepID=A0A3D8RZW4_9HELO|nr:acyl-CoA binding protein [Coleophoma cylindrospora]
MSDFETAVIDSKKLTSKPGNDDLLELYGLYKVATGEDISTSEQPGTFDLKHKIRRVRRMLIAVLVVQGKAKKRAWQKIVDEGITSDEAKARYVAKIAALKESCGYDANKAPEAVGGK